MNNILTLKITVYDNSYILKASYLGGDQWNISNLSHATKISCKENATLTELRDCYIDTLINQL